MHNRNPTCVACAFLLFLSPVSPACRQGTEDDCKKAEFVNGGNLAGKGFDVLRLTVQEMQWANVDQWKTTSGGCTLCDNPLLKGKPIQKLPLIITDWKVHTSCQQKVQHTVLSSVLAVAEKLTELRVRNDWRKGLDVNLSTKPNLQWALAGSNSKITQDCIRKSSQDKHIFLLHHISCTYYKFRLSNDRLLSVHFEHSLNNLPERYDASSKMDYFKLIRTYGTHFGTEFDVGAHFRYLTAIPVCKAVLENAIVSELSHCLASDLGVAFDFDGVVNSLDFQMCEEKKKNPEFFRLLSKISEEWWGGSILSHTHKEWLESAKSMPALLSHSLEPLHNLVAQGNPRRDSLQQALGEYMRERALWRNCNRPCPSGSQLRDGDLCSCKCPNNNLTNSVCCSQKRGLAKLTVTIERAERLWGDTYSHSDGYVILFFNRTKRRTCTVWNNNRPFWNETFDFGVIELNANFPPLQLWVWDEDYGWNDDSLGKCDVSFEPFKYESQSCFLDYNGKLHFKYHLVCGHHLGGHMCRDYSPPLPYNDYYYNYDSY